MTAFMFCKARIVCSSIPPATTAPVTGSKGMAPDVYKKCPTLMPWENGPIAGGAPTFRVSLRFNVITAYAPVVATLVSVE